MKRSEINRIIREMEDLVHSFSFSLPPFCNWTPDEWKTKGHAYDEIRDCMLGWDITDFGSGDFDACGFGLITLRNGKAHDPRYTKPYAEKLLMLRDGQMAPFHYHWYKREDIINRGGGTLLITVFNGEQDRQMNQNPVSVHTDGLVYDVPAGTQVKLTPGESISILPYQYHRFDVLPGTGKVLIGEVSMCNDDTKDNCFFEPTGRFPKIEEDEPPYRFLCNEYPKAID